MYRLPEKPTESVNVPHTEERVPVHSRWHWGIHRAAVDHLGWYGHFPAGATRRVLFLSDSDYIAKLQIFPWYYYRDYLQKSKGIEIKEIPVKAFLKSPERFRDPHVDAVCFQSGFDLDQEDMNRVVAQIRSACPSANLAYLDWFAPTDLRYAAVLMKNGIKAYLKKNLLRDRTLYQKETFGDTNLTDYYSRRFHIPYPTTKFEVPESFFSQCILGPNFFFSASQVTSFLKSVPIDQKRPFDLHCRIATSGTPWYRAMREQARDRVHELKGMRIAGCEAVSARQYLGELRRSKMCFSPFGYGEVCLRDYEAVMSGALLVKPDMGHVETEPDIFVAHETYVPVKWDGSDLQEKCARYLEDEGARRRITQRAFQVIQEYISSHRFLEQMDAFFGLLFAGAPAPSIGSSARA